MVNDGLVAGGPAALLQLDRVIRGWSKVFESIDERPDVAWHNQLMFSLAMTHRDCGVELDATHNLQLSSREVEKY
jgi:hypothetical protein